MTRFTPASRLYAHRSVWGSNNTQMRRQLDRIMKTISPATACLFASFLLGSTAAYAQSIPADVAATPLIVAMNGRPQCSIAVAGPSNDWLMQQAVQSIRSTIERWSGATLPVDQANGAATGQPAQPFILLATLDDLRRELRELASSAPFVQRVAFLDDEGFACTPHKFGETPCLLVVGRTPRGVYNGAVWLRDFCIDGTKDNLHITCEPTVRTPQLPARAAYTLTIWGPEAEYTATDWATIFDSYARDGFDRVYFWISGHFPSKRFPQAYKCRDGKWDTTEKSNIGSVEDLKGIIRAAHDRGLKIYAGGALGAWCCTCMLTDLAPGTRKTPKDAPYPEPSSLCPSHPTSRQALIDYYAEVFDALPEADGLFIESADEWGGCHCAACARKIDDAGSTQFGQSQLTLVQEIMDGIWRNHPHARLCYTIGYDEHRSDPAYYQLIRQMSDPRMEWMEARDSWKFPGPAAEQLPACSLSRQVMRWRQYYNCSLDQLVQDAARVGQSGMFGLITAFEPGFATGSFHTQIPYPTDTMPYVLTGFVWREATWSLSPTIASIRERVQRRFFGREAPANLGGDLWNLRELIREASGSPKNSPALQEKLTALEANIEAARSGASPKTAETLDLMTQAIADVRSHVK
jgi:hypothetical protein